jgi:uncharacterized OB-fold protein
MGMAQVAVCVDCGHKSRTPCYFCPRCGSPYIAVDRIEVGQAPLEEVSKVKNVKPADVLKEPVGYR